jgi:hypothetical protein
VRAKEKAKTVADEVQPPTNMLVKVERTNSVAPAKAKPMIETQVLTQEPEFNLWPWLGGGVFICIVAVLLAGRSKRQRK